MDSKTAKPQSQPAVFPEDSPGANTGPDGKSDDTQISGPENSPRPRAAPQSNQSFPHRYSVSNYRVVNAQ